MTGIQKIYSFFCSSMASFVDYELRRERIEAFSKSVHSLSFNLSNENIRRLSTILSDFFFFLDAIPDYGTGLESQYSQTILMALLHLYRPMAIEKLHENDTIMEPSLKIMHYILSKTLIKQLLIPQFTTELLIFFGTLIYRDNKPKRLSEEVKHLVVKCISSALPAKYKEGRYSSFEMSPNYKLIGVIRNESFLPKASQGIKGLIDIIQQEKNIQLRLDALTVLNQYLIDNLKEIDMIATMFPGTASKLCTTLTQQPEKESHLIVSGILRTLGELIHVLLSDENNDTLVEINTFQDIVKARSFSAKQDPATDSTGKLRTKEWYEKTKTGLLAMLTLAFKNRSYTDWRKRLAYLDFAYTLLSISTRTLDNCVRLLIQVIVLHRDDPYDQVSNKSLVYMESLRHYPSFESTIAPILKDELYECIMKFPKHMISGDEQEKINILSLITGLVLFLDKESKNVLSTALTKSSDGWMTALEINKESLHTLEEQIGQKFIEQAGSQGMPLYPKIRFKHIVNDDTAERLTRMLNFIGRYCDLQTWIHHYMRYVSTDSLNQSEPQAAFIVHSLLAGAVAADGRLEKEEDIVDDWINYDHEYFEKPDFLKIISRQVLHDTVSMLTLAASIDTKPPSAVTKAATLIIMDEDSSYVLNICFGLQLVGLTTSVIDIEDLQELLITMLYPLLAHLGSSNVYIHTYALITLNTIALTCGLKNARELAITNIDYVINMISQHISVLSVHNRVPFVLKALINVSGSDSIKFLQDTVQEICDTLDRYHHDNWLSSELCSVLAEIVYIVERDLSHHEPRTDKMQEEQDINCEQAIVSEEISMFIQHEEEDFNAEYKSMEEIGKYFLGRQEKGLNENLNLEQAIKEGNTSFNKNGKERVIGEEKEIEEAEEAITEKEKEEPLTYEQTMVKEIMEKASHFLTASSAQLRSQMLQLLGSGVFVLSNQASTLNILVHDIWTFIVNRFDDKENYVVYHAALLIEKISTVSTDFLSKKFAQHIWPRFKNLLKRGADLSVSNAESKNYSIYSTYHRTQLCILRSLTNILKHVPVRQPLAKEILEETKFYYSHDKVHSQLRETCLELLDSLFIQQPDTVWLYQFSLNSELQAKLGVSPSPLLEPFVIPKWINPKAYTLEQNTRTILL